MKGLKRRVLLEKVFESSLDAIVITDVKGYILDVNKAYGELTGFKKEKIMGKHTSEFSPMKEGTYECTTGESIQINKRLADNI